jgi:hypothetical protein
MDDVLRHATAGGRGWRWLLLALVVALPAHGLAQSSPAVSGGAGPYAPGVEAAKRKAETDLNSYALGMNFGQQARQQSIELALDPFINGLNDALNGRKTRLTEKQARAVVAALLRTQKRKQAALRAMSEPDMPLSPAVAPATEGTSEPEPVPSAEEAR